MEKLLMEVERKNVLTPDKKSAKFNPIIFLGEYLMRHNPRYSISTKPGPYLRGMKMVTEELKTEMPGTTSERLARMRAEAKNKRKEREQVDNMKSQLKEMRKEALAIQFKQWTVDVSGRIPVYVHSYTEHFSHEMFQEILKHLHRCAGDFQEAVKHDMWRQMFTDLFLDCDYGKVGKAALNLISIWPIIELQEIELMDLWGGLDDQEVCEELREKLVLSQTGISEGEILACGPVDDNKQGTSRVKTSVREGLFVQMGMSEAEAGGTSKEENQAAESSDAEVRKEGEDVASAVKSTDFAASDLDGSTIDSEKSSFREAIKMERQTESASADRQEEAFPGSAPTGYSLSRDGEPRSEKQVEEEQFSLGREPDTETDREEDYSVWDKESGSEGQVSQEGDNWTAEATNTISGPTPEAITVTSEARAVADMDVTASEQDAPLAEVVKETPARTESFSRQQGSPFGQQTSSETRLQDEDLLQDQGKGKALSFLLSAWSHLDIISQYRKCRIQDCVDICHVDCAFCLSDLHPIMADIQNLWASHTRSAFDESCLNLPQFVQLMETFVGEDTSLPTVERLIAFIKEEYKQTEEEKMEQLEKGHRISHLAQRKLLLEALFTKWDKNASGFLDLEEVDAILSSFNEGMEKEALMKAKKHLCCRYPQLSRVGKLSPKAFQAFLELVASEFPDDEDKTIDDLVEFLTTSVERSHMECLQSLARRKWLHSIQQAAETSGASMEQLYKAVFKALSQDAEAHGDNKKISAYIALLEENQLSPERGQILLHYVACTADDAPYVLNQILYRDMKGVSFAAVDEGKPIHVPRVELHGNIHFWNYDRPVEERKGSLLVLPLHNARWKVFGILGLDTLRDQCEKTIFLTHEISFYQGVSHAFSKAYHSICTLENVLQMTVTALDWLYPRAPTKPAFSLWQIRDYALRKMITIDKTGQKEIHSSPSSPFSPLCSHFRDYLFKCIESSEIIHTSVCGVCHTAVPLRDLSGQALGVFDISIGHHQKLPPQEHKDLQRMLKMAQAACSEILKKSLEEAEPTYGLEAECVADLRHAGILFHQFMLQDLRECVQKLDAESFAEIKSYVEPPALVHSIVKAVLLLLHPNWKDSETTENWSQCKLVRLLHVEALFFVLPPPRRCSGICQG
uniref:EF-hand calcium binding domain 5 n=1 Tax=Athene cunicularia TaxID=194338 RepID=A0A663MFX1_ATHCN